MATQVHIPMLQSDGAMLMLQYGADTVPCGMRDVICGAWADQILIKPGLGCME